MFLQSTYGDGDPTDGSADFCRWLEETATDGRMPDMLEDMHFCTFGLGNRSYEHFNAAAKQVDKAISGLGGKKMMKITLGDDDKSLEEDFEEDLKRPLNEDLEGGTCAGLRARYEADGLAMLHGRAGDGVFGLSRGQAVKPPAVVHDRSERPRRVDRRRPQSPLLDFVNPCL